MMLEVAGSFLDVMDGAIVNVAMPAIRTYRGCSVPGLRWVLSGYMVTRGGFSLLGGRAGPRAASARAPSAASRT